MSGFVFNDDLRELEVLIIIFIDNFYHLNKINTY